MGYGRLNPVQHERLKSALVAAFRRDLAQMVYYVLGQRLVDILPTSNSDVDGIAFELIEWCEAQGYTHVLITGALQRRPENEALAAAVADILANWEYTEILPDGVVGGTTSVSPVIPDSRTYKTPSQLMQPHNFDLDDILHKCLDALLGDDVPGLRWFLIACASATLVKNLCERLKESLEGESKMFIEPLLNIHPILTPVSLAVKRANKFKTNLREGDVILQVLAQDEGLAIEFWRQLSEACRDITRNRVIVIMALNPSSSFSDLEGVVVLPEPNFTKVHVHLWIKNLVDALHWPPHFIIDWTERMLSACTIDERLDFDLVYAHIDGALRHLPHARSHESFLNDFLQGV